MSTTTLGEEIASGRISQTELDANLETAFADAIGPARYQRLLDEQWLPFAGKTHMKMPFAAAVDSEVQSAIAFLEST